MAAQPSNEQADLFMKLMESDCATVEQLNLLLSQERDLLESSQRNEITSILENKQNHLVQLDNNNQKRMSLLESLGFPINKQGINQFVSNLNTQWQSKILPQLSTWREALHQVRDANAVNGQIINRSKLSIESLLTGIRGIEEKCSVYGSNGKSNNDGVYRTIAKA